MRFLLPLFLLAACGEPSAPWEDLSCEAGLEECYLDPYNATSWLVQASDSARCRDWFKACADVERVPPHRAVCTRVSVVWTSTKSQGLTNESEGLINHDGNP